MNKPNFFVVGAARCGTTSLYNYLKQHPQVYMSPIKEPHFFSTDFEIEKMDSLYLKDKIIDFEKYFSRKPLEERHIAHIKEAKYYWKLFEDVKNEIAVGEASTGYLYSKVAAKNIRNEIPNAKIIIILRNPIERAYSHYLMDLNKGLISGNFLKEIIKDYDKPIKGWGITHLYIDLGLYYEQVERYLDIFPKKQIKIIFFDDLKNNFQKVFDDICEFLGIEVVSLKTYKKHNVSVFPRNPKLNKVIKQLYLKNVFSKLLPKRLKSKLKNILYKKQVPPLNPTEKNFLIRYFYEDIKRLENLLQKDLSNWYNL